MSRTIRLLPALPFVLLIAGCVAGGNDQVNTVGEIEATTDTAISGQNVPGPSGVASVAP